MGGKGGEREASLDQTLCKGGREGRRKKGGKETLGKGGGEDQRGGEKRGRRDGKGRGGRWGGGPFPLPRDAEIQKSSRTCCIPDVACVP